MTTTFQNIIQRLQARGVITDQQEQPRRCRDLIPMRCSTFGHEFNWDLKFVEKIINDKYYDKYPCLCARCRTDFSTKAEADAECQRLGVVLVNVTSTSYTYKLPCGHEQTTDKKTVKKFQRTPYCLECCKQAAIAKQEQATTDTATADSNDNPTDKVIIDRLVKRLNRVLGKNTEITQDSVKDILDYVYKRLLDFHCIKAEIMSDDEGKDLLVDIKCSGNDDDSDEDYHRITYSLRQMLYILKRMSGGYIRHPCPICNKK